MSSCTRSGAMSSGTLLLEIWDEKLARVRRRLSRKVFRLYPAVRESYQALQRLRFWTNMVVIKPAYGDIACVYFTVVRRFGTPTRTSTVNRTRAH
eukprot:scaffold497032_cov20-Prasinocladus_malaysianus.AAC.1